MIERRGWGGCFKGNFAQASYLRRLGFEINDLRWEQELNHLGTLRRHLVFRVRR